MVRFGLFIVVLILVFAPLVWLQAEDEAPVMTLISGDPGLLAGGVPADPEAFARVFRSPDSPTGKLFLERRLEGLPDQGPPRLPKVCPAQASPGEPAPAPGTAGTAGRAATARDLCDVGYEISRMAPCTSAEDCPAYELWSSQLGPPGLQPAQPQRVPRVLTPSRVGAVTRTSPGDDR